MIPHTLRAPEERATCFIPDLDLTIQGPADEGGKAPSPLAIHDEN